MASRRKCEKQEQFVTFQILNHMSGCRNNSAGRRPMAMSKMVVRELFNLLRWSTIPFERTFGFEVLRLHHNTVSNHSLRLVKHPYFRGFRANPLDFDTSANRRNWRNFRQFLSLFLCRLGLHESRVQAIIFRFPCRSTIYAWTRESGFSASMPIQRDANQHRRRSVTLDRIVQWFLS